MIDGKDLKKVQKRLGALRYKAPAVMNRALNRAITHLKKVVVAKTTEKYNIKPTPINKTLTIKRSTRASMGAGLYSEGTKEPIKKYKVLPRNGPNPKSKRRIQVAVKQEDPKTLFHAFVIQRYGGAVYERKTSNRYPLRQIYGPAVPQILDNPDTRKQAMKEAWKMYEKRLDHEIKYQLEARK